MFVAEKSAITFGDLPDCWVWRGKLEVNGRFLCEAEVSQKALCVRGTAMRQITATQKYFKINKVNIS